MGFDGGIAGAGVRASASGRHPEAILVADPDRRSRAQISRQLRSVGYEPTELASGDEVLEEARRQRPGLVIIEVELPGTCGYEVCRRLRDQYAEGVSIIFVSGTRTKSFDHVAGILLGADDYINKPMSGDELLARVGRLIRRPALSKTSASLTSRERQVLGLLESGLRHKQIAERLCISPKTVGTHVEHIFTKLGAKHRLQAIALAHSDQLVVAPS